MFQISRTAFPSASAVEQSSRSPGEGRRYSELGFLDEVRALCLAAINGRLVETVRFQGAKVVGARAKTTIGSVEVGDSWRKVFTNPFRRSTQETFSYEPSRMPASGTRASSALEAAGVGSGGLISLRTLQLALLAAIVAILGAALAYVLRFYRRIGNP
jgi:hypothetical protein